MSETTNKSKHCQECEEHIFDLLEGDVEESTLQEFRERYKDCHECLQEVDALAETLLLTRSNLTLVEPPASLDKRILDFAQQHLLEKQRVPDISWFQKLTDFLFSPTFRAAASFAVVFLVVGAMFIQSNGVLEKKESYNFKASDKYKQAIKKPQLSRHDELKASTRTKQSVPISDKKDEKAKNFTKGNSQGSIATKPTVKEIPKDKLALTPARKRKPSPPRAAKKPAPRKKKKVQRVARAKMESLRYRGRRKRRKSTGNQPVRKGKAAGRFAGKDLLDLSKRTRGGRGSTDYSGTLGMGPKTGKAGVNSKSANKLGEKFLPKKRTQKDGNKSSKESDPEFTFRSTRNKATKSLQQKPGQKREPVPAKFGSAHVQGALKKSKTTGTSNDDIPNVQKKSVKKKSLAPPPHANSVTLGVGKMRTKSARRGGASRFHKTQSPQRSKVDSKNRYFQIATALWRKKRYSQALRFFRKSVIYSRSLSSFQMRMKIAQFFIKHKDYRRTRTWLQECIHQDPKHKTSYKHLLSQIR